MPHPSVARRYARFVLGLALDQVPPPVAAKGPRSPSTRSVILPQIRAGKLRGRAGVANPDFKSAMNKFETLIAFKQGEEFQKFFEADVRRLANGARKVGRAEET